MIKKMISGFLESDNPDYVLVHKRVVVVNGFAYGIALEHLADKTNADLEILADAIMVQAEVELNQMTREEVEEIIRQSINTNRETLILYPN